MNGQDEFRDKSSHERIAPGRVLGISVRGESVGQGEACFSRSDDIQRRRACNSADDLCDHVRSDLTGLEAISRHQSDRDRGIQVTPGNMADRVRHREHGQPEREGDAEEPNSHIRKRGRQHGAAASSKNQPKCADQLGCTTFTKFHHDPS